MPESERSQLVSVNLTGFQMESHVSEAFRTAWALANDRPVDAALAIRAGVIVSEKRKVPSPAFAKLHSLFPIPDLDTPPPDRLSSADLTAFPLAPAFASAFTVAEKFFDAERRVWGRDYVTLALLSGDPSLSEVAEQVKSTVEPLQDEWFRFVTSSGARRSAEEWKKWWRSAGVPTGEYRAVLTLAAFGVGRADAAPEILEGLHASQDGSFREWLGGAQSDAVAGILQDVDAVTRALKKSGAPELDDRLESYRKWAREVGRYSFQWHLRPNSQASGSIP